jgi:hypothetical protein
VTRADRKAEKTAKKAAKKTYDRNHAQLKRLQAMHAALLASQLRRARKRDKNEKREAS